MGTVLGPLKASYTRSELLDDVRSQFTDLRKADQGEARVYPDHYDIRVPDSAPDRHAVSLDLPTLTSRIQVDSRLEPGFLRNSMLTVTRFQEGDILVQKATFPQPWSPVRTIEVQEVRVYQGRPPQYTFLTMGITDQGREFTNDAWSGDVDFAAEVPGLLAEARNVAEQGGHGPFGFLFAPRSQDSGYAGRSPL